MNKKSLWKLILILAIPCIIGFMPAPAGLSELAWVLFGIYLAAIVGLVIKPFPEPVVLLIAVAASMVVVGNLSGGEFKTTAVLSGYSSGTTWLVFSAFTLSAAFVTTGLGKRIAYLLIGKIGSTTLGLGYVTVFLDLVLAPATPSNTARAGGIVLPIINSVAVALGSEPEKSPRRVGHYLMMSIYMVTKTTSYMFFTAMAGNILALKMINDILHLQISWGGWALAAGLPGIIMLLVTPLVIYTMYPPEIKKVDNKTIAKAGLAELGPMKIREKMLLGVFVLALLGWIFSKSLGVDESTVAIVVMATMLLLGIVTWEDVVKNKGGWNTLIWYGGIIGLSSLLSKVKFFEWLAEVFKNNLAFDGHGNVAFFVIIFLSIIVRYFFASGSAYIVAMLPVFAMLANVSGAPLMLTALALLFSNSYGGMVTHYGGAAGPVIFGAGDTPINNGLSIRHTTRNFPNREGSKPANGQMSAVALMDARSIAATAANGGYLTSASELDCWDNVPEYAFDVTPYKNRVYQGFVKGATQQPLIYGPNIKDWPELGALTDNIVLKVCSKILDEVTTTDELIPSGETSSYRSNPIGLAEFTLSRRDPGYVGRSKATAELENQRLAGNVSEMAEVFARIKQIAGQEHVDPLQTEIGSMVYAVKPGDGSAREQAASCQRVIGGLANIAEEYATKRYRSNVINWGMLPLQMAEAPTFEVGDYIYIPGIKAALDNPGTTFKGYVIHEDAPVTEITLYMESLTAEEREIIKAGSLINFNKNRQM